MAKTQICISLDHETLALVDVFQRSHKIRHRSSAVQALLALGAGELQKAGKEEDLRALVLELSRVQTAILIALSDSAGIQKDAKKAADGKAGAVIRRALEVVKTGKVEEAE